MSGSDSWKEIKTFRHDDPIPIRKDQIHFVNDDVAFIFMGSMYAATRDAGKTWILWDACTSLEHENICNYEGIKEINLSPTGIGSMIANPNGSQDELPILQTDDFGRTWHISGKTIPRSEVRITVN